VTLRGWLFVPGAKGPAPAITMAHGYAGEGARLGTICTGFCGSRFCRAGP
jgi:cephalosporin-C deacetylase-like acetyl esterase